jgi:hypothetical protein
MSKLMTRLAKLKEFQDKGDNLRARSVGIEAEAQALDKEFSEFLKAELGVSGQNLHMSGVMLKLLESSVEPTRD